MQRWNCITIVGVGLIGGSIGLAVRQRQLAQRVIGVARREATRVVAVRRGAVDEATDDLESAAAEADLIVVCTPVGIIADQVRQCAAAAAPEALITDAGSTKQRMVSELEEFFRQRAGAGAKGPQFVGSHPLAGSEKTGPAAAEAELFVDRLVVVTPAAGSSPDALQKITDFWQALGARVATLSAQQHDRLLAMASHLPHLAASALAAATETEALPLTAGGWSDATRVAAGDPEMWLQILRDNRGHTLKALDNFEKVLTSFREALEQDDPTRLKELLEAGKRNRDAVGN